MQTTLTNPYIIRSPRVAFLNLGGAEAQPLMDEDRAALGQYFATCTVSEKAVPVCDVLVLYCTIEPTGQITGYDLTLRQIIRDSRSVIVLVASENAGERYIAAARQEGYGTANLVMTLSRNENSFVHFFQQLFGKIAAGMTMPMAWVDLAPQIPGRPQGNVPETIFACEAGHVTFAT